MSTDRAPLPIVKKNYDVKYKNEYDQVEILRGTLLHSNIDGFCAFCVDNRTTIIPKDRIVLMREVTVEPTATPADGQKQVVDTKPA